MGRPRKYEFYSGQKIGTLTILGNAPSRGHNRYWDCVCECGGKYEVSLAWLVSDMNISCGCKHQDRWSNNRIDKRTFQKIRHIWKGMISRCNDKNMPSYKDYGGRGIFVCEQWRGDSKSFILWSLANGYRDGLSIDRIDNNKEYSPSNCRWASHAEQQLNKRNTIFISAFGMKMPLKIACQKTGINYHTARERLRRGISEHLAIMPTGLYMGLEEEVNKCGG